MSTTLMPHDAPKTLSDLRDHLARHDKPIAFLFGAGTSCAVRVPDKAPGKTVPLVPAVAGLTELVKTDVGALGKEFSSAWAQIEAHCKAQKVEPNVEVVLSRLRMMISAMNSTDLLVGLKKDDIEKLEARVRKTIATVVTPDLSKISSEVPHRKFARWLIKTSRQNPIEIFTVNYDVLIEHGLEAERIPIFDGFVGSHRPFFHSDSLRRSDSAPGANWTRLWKMHGSVTWRRHTVDGRERVVRSEPNQDGEMIYPSYQKYDESRQQPYSAFTDRLSRFLEQDDALLIVAGFSFADEHVNNLIFGALENRPRTHVYALQFEEVADSADLVKRASQRANMIVVSPKTGIIGGKRAIWAPVASPPFMAGVFELVDEPSTGGASSKVGRMKIGDFACFCSFLESMTA
jgi:hypothetical protein